jgi:hypothetical protein
MHVLGNFASNKCTFRWQRPMGARRRRSPVGNNATPIWRGLESESGAAVWGNSGDACLGGAWRGGVELHAWKGRRGFEKRSRRPVTGSERPSCFVAVAHLIGRIGSYSWPCSPFVQRHWPIRTFEAPFLQFFCARHDGSRARSRLSGAAWSRVGRSQDASIVLERPPCLKDFATAWEPRFSHVQASNSGASRILAATRRICKQGRKRKQIGWRCKPRSRIPKP